MEEPREDEKLSLAVEEKQRPLADPPRPSSTEAADTDIAADSRLLSLLRQKEAASAGGGALSLAMKIKILLLALFLVQPVPEVEAPLFIQEEVLALLVQVPSSGPAPAKRLTPAPRPAKKLTPAPPANKDRAGRSPAPASG